MRAKVTRWVVKIFGNVQFFPHPLFCVVWGDTHYRVKGPEMRAITDLLQAGDILLRRYDRYVSGWFIPGHFTHVGLAADGRTVVHATTHGVVEDVLTFLRSDQIVVLRVREADGGQARKAAGRAKELLGKEYDFLFDAANDERFYCSELAKHAWRPMFDDMEAGGVIEPDRFLGREVLEVVHDSREWRK